MRVEGSPAQMRWGSLDSLRSLGMTRPCSEDGLKIATERHVYLCARRGTREELSRDNVVVKPQRTRRGVFSALPKRPPKRGLSSRERASVPGTWIFTCPNSIANLVRPRKASSRAERTAGAGGTLRFSHARGTRGAGRIFVLGGLPHRRAAAGVVSSALRAPSPRERGEGELLKLLPLAPREGNNIA